MSTEMMTARSDRPIYLALAAAAVLFMVAAPAVYMIVPLATVTQSVHIASMGALLVAGFTLLIVGLFAEAREAVARVEADMPEPMEQEPVLPMARAA